MSKPRSTQRAIALIPLAILSAAWTASVAGVGTGTNLADATTEPTLPDGSTVPTQAIEAPASVSATGATAGGMAPGSDTDVPHVAPAAVSTSGIPSAALSAYQRAETVINAADTSCHLPWQLVAAIGRVESDHGRTDGNSLDAQGVAQPGIFGRALDGSHGTSRIADTDAGQYDGDSQWDRAVGPMQFIPSTWSVVGVDADGDGQRNPQDINDAALATAVYLCSGDDDLSTTPGQRSSVYRYNHSTSYVDLVLSVMRAYLDGEFTSMPNGVTSAGYLVPDSTPAQPVRSTKHHQANGQQHSSTDQTTPTEAPTQEPSSEPTSSSGGHSDDGGGHPNTPHLPTVSVPPLPSTSIKPVDEILTRAQAILQCTLDGYVDNILKSDDPFDQCVKDYMS